MATYKFPQFNTQIVNPTIEVDSDSIIVHALRNEISLFVSLSTTDSMLYGVEVENIPVTNLNYEGEANLMTRALEGLAQYEVETP